MWRINVGSPMTCTIASQSLSLIPTHPRTPLKIVSVVNSSSAGNIAGVNATDMVSGCIWKVPLAHVHNHHDSKSEKSQKKEKSNRSGERSACAKMATVVVLRSLLCPAPQQR